MVAETRCQDKYELEPDFVLTFGNGDISVSRSHLYDAIRTVLSGVETVRVNDVDGESWKITIVIDDHVLPKITISSETKRKHLPDFSVLSSNATTRIKSLERVAEELDLPINAREQWRRILEVRPLDNDEVDDYFADCRDTAAHVARDIRRSFSASEVAVSDLVPKSKRYYERLVGVYDGSSSVLEYAAKAGCEVIQQRVTDKSIDGFLGSLLLSSHTSLCEEIRTEHLSTEELIQAFDYIEKYGDVLSLIGAIEIGIRDVHARPELEAGITRLIHRIINDDANGSQSLFKLFSALFVMVDGELARLHLFSGDPPFYRRMASLAHAALIQRQFLRSRKDVNAFTKWVFTNHAVGFYTQNLCDMHLEPRWNPDLASPEQIRADCLGRILITGYDHQNTIPDGELRDLIFGDNSTSLTAMCSTLQFLAGPLEGGVDNPSALPSTINQIILQQINGGSGEEPVFNALINSALIYHVDASHAELAVKAIKNVNHCIVKNNSNDDLIRLLLGLAYVAVVTRSTELADELRILVRRYRHDSPMHLSVVAALRVCMVASAAAVEVKSWKKYVGEWLTELAFSDLENDEIQQFHVWLTSLLQVVPELWVSCSKADAALMAIR